MGGKLLENLVLFGRLCRELGMRITPNVMIEVAQGLELINLTHKDDVYQTMRALMVTRKSDFGLFDQAFDLFWQRRDGEPIGIDLRNFMERQRKTQFMLPPGSTPDEDNNHNPNLDPNQIAIIQTFSMVDRLRYKDFSEMTGEELSAAQAMIGQLPWSLGVRRSRRYRPGDGVLYDLRRVFRRNLRYGGEPLFLPKRTPKIKPRPLVLLCDISGSMERYTRILLHFIHTLSHTMYQVELFVYATHLTRITRTLRQKSVDVALKETGITVRDWGSGTRTGDAFHEFNYRWGRRVLGRGAVVLIITDGWDRGDPAQLMQEAARLQHSAYRVIWLNPLLGSNQYEPLTRGAQALLPYVDNFLPVHNLASLQTLAKELWRFYWRRPIRSPHAHLIL